MLALPNITGDVPALRKNANFIRERLAKRGFATRLLSASSDSAPAVYGELKTPGAHRTILFYAHYDAQPVSQSDWRSDPFQPVVRERELTRDIDWRAAARLDPEWRIFARSASDDKGSIEALLGALDALQAEGRHPNINVKVIYEGEEEAGSPHLLEILAANKALLAADLFILGDGPGYQSGMPQISFVPRASAQSSSRFMARHKHFTAVIMATGRRTLM